MLAEPCTPMDRNECMIPHTVPNSPINGVVLPVVARKSSRRDRRATSRLMALLRTRLIPLMSRVDRAASLGEWGSLRRSRSFLAMS